MACTDGICIICRTELELRKIKSGPVKPYFLTWMHPDQDADVRLKLTAAYHFAEVSYLQSLSPVVVRLPADWLYTRAYQPVEKGKGWRRAGNWAGCRCHFVALCDRHCEGKVGLCLHRAFCCKNSIKDVHSGSFHTQWHSRMGLK